MDEWRADVDARVAAEKQQRAEEEAERAAVELQRQEAEYAAAQKVGLAALLIDWLTDCLTD